MRISLSALLWLAAYALMSIYAGQLARIGHERNVQEAALEGTRGVVLVGRVSATQAWGRAIVGDVCIRVDSDTTWYCIQPEYVPDGNLARVLQQAQVGTPVFLKAHRGQVVELILGPDALNRRPDSPRVIPFNPSLAEAYLSVRRRGDRLIYTSIGLMVLLVLLHLGWRSWRQKKRASGNPTDTPMLRV